MKFLVTFLIVIHSTAFAAINLDAGNCKFTHVFTKSSDAWKGELDVWGSTSDDYSEDQVFTVSFDLSEQENSVFIGKQEFSPQDNQSELTIKDKGRKYEVKVTLPNNPNHFKLSFVKATERGALMINKNTSSNTRYKTAAIFDCKNYSKEMKFIEDAFENPIVRTRRLTRSAYFGLTKYLRQNFERIDTDYELGDGYYSIYKEVYYAVYSPEVPNKIIGYIRKSMHNYSQGEDIVATTYFLHNGLRFLGPIEDL